MFVAALVMVVGIAAVAVLSHRGGYRLGGVMVLPLLAIYTFREPLSPLVFAVGTAVAFAALWAVREYTLNHGRRVFLVAVLSGASATVLFAYVVAVYTPVALPFDDAEVVASIFPGVAAYNLMRLDPEDRLRDVVLMVAVFAGLVGLGVVCLLVFEGRSMPAPPVLALPTSELVTWLGIETRGDPVTQLTPHWLSVGLLAVDVVGYEAMRKRYDLRLAGIIVVPLVAVFSIRFEHAAVVFAVGATVVFALVAVLHWISLLYGRVLLGVSLVLGTVYALAVGMFVRGAIPGLTLFFLGLFVGVAAYNLHRVSPKLRAASLRISAGLFVVFYATLAALVDVPPSGLLADPEPAYVLAGAMVVALAGFELYRLERSRPSLAAFASASVFAAADVDGADTDDSPLVAGDTDGADDDSGLRFDTAASTDGGVDEDRTGRDDAGAGGRDE